MTIGRSAWLVFAAFLIAFALLLEAGQSGVLVLRGAIWGSGLVASGYAVTCWWRGEKPRPPTAGLPDAVRRWLIGESGHR